MRTRVTSTLPTVESASSLVSKLAAVSSHAMDAVLGVAPLTLRVKSPRSVFPFSTSTVVIVVVATGNIAEVNRGTACVPISLALRSGTSPCDGHPVPSKLHEAAE